MIAQVFSTEVERERLDLCLQSNMKACLSEQLMSFPSTTVHEFCHNYLTFSAKPTVNIDASKIAEKLVPIPQNQVQQAIQQTLSVPSPTTHHLQERKGKINYQALYLGQEIKKDIQQAAQEVKDKFKSMRKSVRKSAKAAVTKLAPGAFSPKQPSPATAPSSPQPSSSSSWNFWPLK
jgi:hypothetical protein